MAFTIIELPGVKQEYITVTLDNNVLTVKCHREHEYKYEDSFGGKRIEHTYSSYARSIRLPTNAEIKHPDVSFENQILNIKFRKNNPSETSKKIEITSK
jgi:HSP20 family protein